MPSPKARRPRSLALRAVRWAAGLVGIACLLAFACELWIASVASAGCFDRVADVPHASAALVLGCSESLPNGNDNPYFGPRIDTAAELFHAGRVAHVIVSGDNHSVTYDEPTAMKAALVERGVPADRVHCDHAGFRTLDSVVRAELVFGQKRFVVVSQRFHAERAVFLARSRGLEAFGFCAPGIAGGVGGVGLRLRLREVAARCMAVLDAHVLGTQPKFLGEPVVLGAAK